MADPVTASTFLRLTSYGSVEADNLDVVLAGVASESGSEGRGGVAAGPAAVREASWSFGPYNHALGVDISEELRVGDCGDVVDDRIGELSRESFLEQIAAHTFTLACGGQVPGLIGGSQLLTLGALRGLRRAKRRPVALLHISAKHRCRSDDLGEAGALLCAHEEGLLLGHGVLQVGVRGPSRDGNESQRALSFGFERMSVDDVRWDIHGCMASVRAKAGQGALYVSVDLSALDVAVCPGVARPAPGGLTVWEVQQVLRAMLGADLVGFDVVGLSPGADVSQMTAIVGVSILHEILAVIAEGRSSSRVSWTSPGSGGRTSA